jgi:hypothetical protein
MRDQVRNCCPRLRTLGMLLQDITSIVLPFGGLDVKVNALRGGIQFGEDSLMFFG